MKIIMKIASTVPRIYSRYYTLMLKFSSSAQQILLAQDSFKFSRTKMISSVIHNV